MNSAYTKGAPSNDSDIGVVAAVMDSFDPRSMEEVLSRTSVEHLQLAKGRFLGQVMRAKFSISTLDWGSYNLPLLATAGMPTDRVTLGFVLAGDGEWVMNGKVFSGPAAVLFAEETELYYRLAPNTQWLAFQVERSLLERIGLSVSQGFAGPVGKPSTGIRQLNQNLQDTLAVLRSMAGSRPYPGVPDPIAFMEQAEAQFFDLLVSACTSAQPGPVNDRRHRSEATRLARSATDYILVHMEEPLRIATICCKLDCDLKSLERAFYIVHGRAPREFLTLARLNKARHLLLDGNGRHSVTDIATACGIQHLGRFAQQYYSWFGERPSETFSRSMLSGNRR